MEVFRVERLEDGKGPYSAIEYRTESGMLWNSVRCPVTDALFDVGTERRPGPYSDGMEGWGGKFGYRDGYFGFANLSQARQWFGGLGHMLFEHYYTLVRFEVPDHRVVRGRKQLVFDVYLARRVELLDPRILDEGEY